MTHAITARHDLTIWRNDDYYEYPIRVVGLDLTDIALALQIRLAGDTPGPPLVSLAKVTSADQGVWFVGKSVVDGVEVSELRIRMDRGTLQALPYEGELGDPAGFEYALVIGGRTRMKGSVLLPAHAYGSDAAPADRDPLYGYGTARQAGMPDAGATLTISRDGGATISIDGADLVSASIVRAESAATRAEAAEAAIPLGVGDDTAAGLGGVGGIAGAMVGIPIGGNPNEIRVKLPTPAVGTKFSVYLTATNTGPAFLTVGGLRRQITNGGAIPIVAGGLPANKIAIFTLSPGGAFVLQDWLRDAVGVDVLDPMATLLFDNPNGIVTNTGGVIAKSPVQTRVLGGGSSISIAQGGQLATDAPDNIFVNLLNAQRRQTGNQFVAEIVGQAGTGTLDMEAQFASATSAVPARFRGYTPGMNDGYFRLLVMQHGYPNMLAKMEQFLIEDRDAGRISIVRTSPFPHPRRVNLADAMPSDKPMTYPVYKAAPVSPADVRAALGLVDTGTGNPDTILRDWTGSGVQTLGVPTFAMYNAALINLCQRYPTAICIDAAWAFQRFGAEPASQSDDPDAALDALYYSDNQNHFSPAGYQAGYGMATRAAVTALLNGDMSVRYFRGDETAAVSRKDLDALASAVGGALTDLAYRPTLASAVADFDVGTFFTSRDMDGVSANPGVKRQYQIVSTAPYWADRGPWADPSDVGLDNVDNTSDAEKPVSAPQAQTFAILTRVTARDLDFGDIAAHRIDANANAFRLRDRAGALMVATSEDLDPALEGYQWIKDNAARAWRIEEERPTPQMFGLIATADDTLVMAAADAHCDHYNLDLHLRDAPLNLVGDFLQKTCWRGLDRDKSIINMTGRLFLRSGSRLGIVGATLRSTMAGVAGLSSVIQAGGTGGGTAPPNYRIEDSHLEFLPNLGDGYHPANNRRLLQFDSAPNLSITRTTLKGGSVWLNSENTNFDVSHNLFERGFNVDQGIGLGDDMIKASTFSSEGRIEFNTFDSPEQDSIDLYTCGGRTVIHGNRSKGGGFIGIQIKALYRWAPYASGSSDVAGKVTQVIVTSNGFFDQDMRNMAQSDQGASIYIHAQDLRYQITTGAVSASGVIRLSVGAAHELQTGWRARVTNVLGCVEANGVWQVTVVDSLTLDLVGSAYVNAYIHDGNGTVTRAYQITGAVAGDGGNVRLTVPGHPYLNGNTLIITGVAGTTEANLAEAVARRVDADHVELVGVPFVHAYTGGGDVSLVLSEKNGPTDIIVSDNLVRGINATGSVAYPAGIVIEGGNIVLGPNIVAGIYKGIGPTPVQAGAAVVIGRMKPSFTPVLPANVTMNGGVYQGEGAGIAIAGRVRSLHINGAVIGRDAETGAKSTYGIVFATGASVDTLSVTGGEVVGTARSIFAAASTGYNIMQRVSFSGVRWDGTVELGAQIDTLTWDGGSVDGALILGAVGKASQKISVRTIVKYAGTSSALRILGANGVTISGQIYGGDRCIQLDGSSNWNVTGAILSPATSINIASSATNAGKVQIATGTHGMSAGDIVLIAGHSVAAVNGKWVIESVPSGTTAVLQGSTFSANGTGGTLRKLIDAPAGFFGETAAITAF